LDRVTQERIGENDARFRDANERIHELAADYGLDGLLPFICECADPQCVEIVRLERDDYRRVRSNPRWFLKVSGHERAEGPAARVVSTHDGWVVAEKVGHAGRVAEELAADEGAVRGEGEP
jgi:hypothetical protein